MHIDLRDRGASAGFTLLEMVVVMAIMALVVGVAAVRIFALIDSWRVRTELDDIEQQFAHLPVLARQRGEAVVLPPPVATASGGEAGTPLADQGAVAGFATAAQEAIHLPPDWKVSFDRPLRVRSNGFCEGAEISIEHGARTYERRVTPPFCKLTAAENAP